LTPVLECIICPHICYGQRLSRFLDWLNSIKNTYDF
jgi:hypothetical protein